VLKNENIQLKDELNAKEKKEKQKTEDKVNITETESNTIKNNISPSSYESKRKEFANFVKKALNAPGLPPMCTDAYFNSKKELIIEVNGEWLILDKELRKDMVFALTESLRRTKKSLDVEGHRQFFSTSGRPLESFYAD